VVGAISGAKVDAPVGSVYVDGRDTPVGATSDLGGIEALEDLPVGVEGGATGGALSEAPSGGPSAASGSIPGGVPPAGISAAPTAAGSSAAAGALEPVLLKDVAEVREVGSDLSGISRTNGEPSLGLNVIKETDANTVEVAADVQKVLDDVREKIGRDQVVVVLNSANDVEESVNGLVEEALVGAVLAILVIFAFLRSLRATLVTAVSLPTSVLAALLFSWADNLTLNIITLAGLTIAIGRVVDDAIVVLENSYRYVQNGYEPEEAALKGTTEVASAITSSTLTTTAVFLPLALVGGIVSKFFVPLSLTVALALFASLVVAVTIIPVLVSVFLGRRAGERSGGRGGGGSEGLLLRVYTPMLRWSLRHRLVVLLLALLAFAGGSGSCVCCPSPSSRRARSASSSPMWSCRPAPPSKRPATSCVPSRTSCERTEP
jgi:HAE1 family hydrophobic/amphiphilic exporter-1